MAEQTATNPQTGEKVVLRGGQWVPMTAAPRPQQARAARQPVAAFPGNPVDLIPQAAGGARISSGYRDPKRNRAAGGVANSYHTRGQALDLVPQNGETMAQLEARLRQSGLPLRELLNEGDHVHVAWEGSPLSPDMTADYFANGGVQVQAQPDQAAPAASEGQFATNPQTGERVQFINGVWTPVQTADPASGAITVEQYDPELEARQADPEYQRAIADARRGSAAVPEWLRALGLGGTLGFLTDINATAQGALQGVENLGRRLSGQEIEYGADMAAQAARDSERDAQAAYASENPIENFALQAAGGLLTPGLGAAGNYISRGGLAAREAAVAGGASAQQAARVGNTARLGLAAQVGAGYGVASGFGYGTGNIGERLDDAAIGGLVGAGTGVIGQGAVDRLTRGAANPGRVSNARLLSREGVDLTPGQMAAEIPVVGNVFRSLEEGASSIPFVGSPIAGARQQSVETFNRAAINRALEPLGEKLPKNVRAGYDAVGHAQTRVSQAYDRALDGVSLRPDEALYDDLGRAINSAVENAGVTGAQRVTREISDRVFRVLQDFDDPITGQQFKALESEFGTLASNAMESTDGATRAVGRAYQAVQSGLRDNLARQNPRAAEEIKKANSAYARLMRVENAAASSVSQADDGVFSPTQLGRAVSQMGSRRPSARGDALMQDLAVAGRNIIPSRTGDSGTATRGAVTALVAGGAGGAINPALGIPVIAASLAYSRPAQSALNAVYRATDSRAASEALQELVRLAQRNPALVPYYEAAAQHVLGLSQRDTQASPQGTASAQAPSAALQRVMQ